MWDGAGDPSIARIIMYARDCDWYWGKLSWEDAEKLLMMCSPGKYLLRDSRSRDSVFSLSYKTKDKVYHTRGDSLLLKSVSYRKCMDVSPLDAFERLVKQCNGRELEMLIFKKDNQFTNSNFTLTTPLRKHECMPSLQFLTRKVIRSNSLLLKDAKLLPSSLEKYIHQSDSFNPPIYECLQLLQIRSNRT